MLSLVRFWLICVLKPRSKTTQRNDLGFTMIELLVSAVVASMIITPILFFVVDVLQTDTREEIRARSEQELQTAADFIRRDLSQAIYIYDGQGVNAIRSQLPDSQNVVLVFWRQEFIPNAVPPPNDRDRDCDNNRCDDAQVFSLVAYYLQTEREPNSPWSDQARISRLQINGGVVDRFNQSPNCRETPCYIAGHEPDPGFDPPPDRTEMNTWEASGPIVDESGRPRPREVLIDYIYPGVVAGLADDHCRTALNLDNATEANLLSGNKGSGFFVCVDWDRTTALVNLRMNAAIRIDPNATEFNPNQRSLFPETNFLVKGLGLLN
ncbi:MAG: hormogonium polysaccharide secretion pseudopilin HpsC [Limnospira sp. PMC 1291.21]|uniref:hormogonium polysaccharide secretion pseudopilin HpsC n=1 Tax=unclassified Limnospira TaxID=2642885 RepID=UPI0028E17518|nr:MULTISPECIES: hormogonium polysaccharide secretion pseudopilin HpsC [unclassified Limnospira]MDT9176431.1 hormogonium polysaccharide secretion pseudopilin HpsC [Limnospira sp. PMC 1238.20]MDT9202058.1 hormogonium polysaccharide secretion pseudopilin HpsC [Limnospira sp. PMC 1243.20]MDT9217474.1 hormogonium polysaccharide secretion pseudopilin HpsC [Limnospira sp. PMC 1240.20]MDT9222620.1 hormogonium polysaccharide secretion pseudopilin HpsC [Limnospira sp. PMC 1279.21]MDT9227666.1 hormogoni